KHSRTPFPNQAKFRSKNPLDLVYGDLCGPISLATHSGKKLIFLLVDDCTRFMWAYFLTSKDQALSTFKEFRQKIEMEIRMKVRMLRTDKGCEFTSNEFTKYCKENGIARQLTAPYSPQQNGVVERRNRTVLSTTRIRGFKDLAEIYQNTQEVEIKTLLFTEEEPRNYKEASTDKKWIEAMEIELDSINKNNTWTLTTLPPDQKAIGLKWVFKTKKDAKGNIIKYKERLVAKGYVQEQGIDFDGVFAPVARIETVRLILALAAHHGWQDEATIKIKEENVNSNNLTLMLHMKNDFGLRQIKMCALMVQQGYDAALETLPVDIEAETLWYGRESLRMEDVLLTPNSKELKKRTEGTKKETGDGLYVRGRSNLSRKAHSGESSWFKSRCETGKLKCFICHLEGHLKRDCLIKKLSGFVKKGKRD
nr:zinc finger, CCHC-type [Tanacetum cinerariifolium]